MKSAGKLRLLPLVATIFFCVSGGPFGLESVMKSGAGMGLLLILVTPLVWAVPAALMTAELASAMPGEGGFYLWVKRAMGPFAGFLCGWWSWVDSWVDIALYPTLFATYATALINQFGGHLILDANPWIKWAMGMTMIVPLTALNIRGIWSVGEATLGFMILLVPFGVMIVIGLAHAVGHPPTGFTPHGKTPSEAFGAGLFIVMWNYFGWDTMSTTAGEIERPQRNFPRALAIGVPLVVLTYFLPAYVGITYVRDLSKWEDGAWTTVAQSIGGSWLACGVAIAGILGACGLFAATLLASSRIPMVLSEDRYLPKPLSRLHPKFGTPVLAILLSAVVYSVLSYQKFKSLAAIDVVVYSAGLLLEMLALVILRIKAPEMPRPFRIPGGWPALALIGVMPFALVMFGIYTQYHDPDEGGPAFLILSALGLLSGVVVYAIGRLRAGPISEPS
jgi:amino acid transporter